MNMPAKGEKRFLRRLGSIFNAVACNISPVAVSIRNVSDENRRMRSDRDKRSVADLVRLTKLDLVEDPAPLLAWLEAQLGETPVDCDVAFETRTLRTGLSDQAELEDWLEALPRDARVKGVVARRSGARLLQRVNGTTTLEPMGRASKTELVAIWPVVRSCPEEES